MIGVEELKEIVEAVLATGRVADEQPVSLLIVSVVGAGKSNLVSLYGDKWVESVRYCNDITAFAIHKNYGKDLQDGKIRHIIIPDLLMPLNKQKDQVGVFIAFLNGLIEEGIARVISRDTKFEVIYPVKCGLIATIARGELVKRKIEWASVGFLSRMLPISYEYSQDTIDQIFESIMNREYRLDKPHVLKLPKESAVDLPRDIAEDIKKIALQVKDTSDEYGFRRHKQLQTLLMGHALMQGRNSVTWDDAVWLMEIQGFIGYGNKSGRAI